MPPAGDPGDVDLHGGRRRDAAPGAAGGLQALQLVQGVVEAPLYGGLVARELEEGVRPLGVPDEVRPSVAVSVSRMWLIS